MNKAPFLIVATGCLLKICEAFGSHPAISSLLASSPVTLSKNDMNNIRRSTVCHGFLQDLLGDAFANDEMLSNDKSQGQLEGPGEDDSAPRRPTLTATQERWRQMNTEVPNVEGRSFQMNFYLSGVPNKDPSNDLYGSKVNISSRDRQVGQPLPEEPTVSDVKISFDADGKCLCESDTPFTKTSKNGEEDGDWLVSDDGRQIRFRILVTGYSRTVQTKGTIQSVAWSNEPDQQLQSSTVYSIPEGWMYGEATLSRAAGGAILWEDGILKIEQSAGLLGAAKKMTPCGKFVAQALEQ